MRLVGVGVGPGDPELVTLKAVRVLQEADLVVVQATDATEQGQAEAMVRALVGHDRIERLVFTPDDPGSCDAAADAVAAHLNDYGGTVAFATVGDPNIHSSFPCLSEAVCERAPESEIETVPGITAMQDLAARSGTVLCEGTESLVLLPMTAGAEALEGALQALDTVVALVEGQDVLGVLDVLRRHDRLDDAVCGAALGLPEERIVEASEVRRPMPDPSTVLAPRRRP